MNKGILIGIGVAVAASVVVFVLISSSGNTQNSTSPTSQNSSESGEVRKIEGYKGNVLAGDAVAYIEFNKSDYDKARAEGKLILLNFYANWCPICRAEAPELAAGFDELNLDNTVAFRVNWKDSDTDQDEASLEDEFTVLSQHTKIFLKDGQVLDRTGKLWKKDDLISAFNSVSQAQ